MNNEVDASSTAQKPVVPAYNAKPFNDFLLVVGKTLKKSIHDGEVQQAGLERLIREVNFGFFTKARTYSRSGFYTLLTGIAPQGLVPVADELANSFQEGQVYNAEFGHKRLQVSHPKQNEYVVSRP